MTTTGPREVEGEPDDPLDLGLAVRQRVERGPGAARGRCAGARLRSLAEVHATGQLADDQEIDAVEQLGLER